MRQFTVTIKNYDTELTSVELQKQVEEQFPNQEVEVVIEEERQTA